MKSVLTFNVEKTLQNNGTADIYNFKIINGLEEYTVTWTNKPSSNGSYLVSYEVELDENYHWYYNAYYNTEPPGAANITENRNSTCRFEGAVWRLYLYLGLNLESGTFEPEIYLLCDNQMFLTIGTIQLWEGGDFLLEMPYFQGTYNTG